MLVWDWAEETEDRSNSICWSGMGKKEKSRWLLGFWPEQLEKQVVIYWEGRLREKQVGKFNFLDILVWDNYLISNWDFEWADFEWADV